MYIRTRHIKLTAEKGWWGLLENPRMDFDIQLGPSKLGPSGPRTIRGWVRKSMCDAPSGRLAMVWRTLMQLNDARYIATRTDSSVEIEVYDPELYRAIKFGRRFKNIEAKMKILRAGENANAYNQVRINEGQRHTDLDFRLENTDVNTCMTIDYWGNGWAMQAVSPWMFIDMFRSEFGPALYTEAQKDKIFEDMKKDITVRCMLIPVAHTGSGGPQTYYKTFARRLTK